MPVGLAQDVGVVDFSMSRMHTARVTGIVLGPTGEPSAPGALTLAPSQRSSAVTSVAVGARIAPDGTFVFPNVPQGQYVIQAYRGRSNAHTEGEFGAVLVSVNTADVTGVSVRTSSGLSVTGRFRFDLENPTTTPEPADFGLTAIPIDFDMSPPNNPASADIHSDWTFDMSGLNGPRRLQMVCTPPGFALEAIRVNGVDVTDSAISLGTRAQSLANVEVVLTDRVTEMSGTVVDDRGRPVGGARVILFSTNRQQVPGVQVPTPLLGERGRHIHGDGASGGQLLCGRRYGNSGRRGRRVAGPAVSRNTRSPARRRSVSPTDRRWCSRCDCILAELSGSSASDAARPGFRSTWRGTDRIGNGCNGLQPFSPSP